MTHARIDRVNELIKEILGQLLIEELDVPRGVFVTVTKVDVSKDLRYARVFLSVFPEKHFARMLQLVDKHVYRIQGEVNQRLSLKPLPRLTFFKDSTEVKAAEIEEVLKQL